MITMFLDQLICPVPQQTFIILFIVDYFLWFICNSNLKTFNNWELNFSY